MKTRHAAMEGRFYPSTRDRIFGQIHELEQNDRYPLVDLNPEKVFGAVLPHAGHIYSGYQTLPFFQLMMQKDFYPETFVIVHPNHTGLGEPMAVDDSEVWRNAAGDVALDLEFAEALQLPRDPLPHSREHSAEVIIPFVQYYMDPHPISIVPICMLEQSLNNAAIIAQAIVQAVEKTMRRIIVLASSDFSHFLSPEVGREMDQKVLEQILHRDPEGVESAVRRHQVSVCGFGPIMTLMKYSEHYHKNYKMEILARGHSGEVMPSNEVVDYISMIFYR